MAYEGSRGAVASVVVDAVAAVDVEGNEHDSFRLHVHNHAPTALMESPEPEEWAGQRFEEWSRIFAVCDILEVTEDALLRRAVELPKVPVESTRGLDLPDRHSSLASSLWLMPASAMSSATGRVGSSSARTARARSATR